MSRYTNIYLQWHICIYSTDGYTDVKNNLACQVHCLGAAILSPPWGMGSHRQQRDLISH